MAKQLNTSHPLYSNLTRSLYGAPTDPKMISLAGGSDTASQPSHEVISFDAGAGITPLQGIARDATHWYSINTTTLVKTDLVGTVVTTNNTPFTSLPAGVDHIGDGFVNGGLLYVPIVTWVGVSETATNQTIAVFNTSDLSLNTQFDISAQSAFTGSGLAKDVDGNIIGTSFYTLSTPHAQQTTLYRFNISTGAFIETKTLDTASVGSQGIVWNGEHYLIPSHDTINVSEQVRIYSADFEFLTAADPTLIGPTQEIEGVEHYDGVNYVHRLGTSPITFDYAGLYISESATLSSPVQFLDNSLIGNAGTLLFRATFHRMTSWLTFMDNLTTANDWECYVDSTNLNWRVNSGSKVVTPVSINNEYIIALTWENTGGNVVVKVGIDGVYQATSSSSTWITPPAAGLYLGGINSSNGQGNNTYSDVVLYDKVLSTAELLTLDPSGFDDIYAASVSGSLSETLESATASASGVVGSAPTGTINVTLADTTGAAAGSVTNKGTLSETLENATSAASGALTVSGAASEALANTTSSASGTLTVFGSISKTLEDVISAASGDITLSGSLSELLENTSVTASGVVGDVVAGAISSTLENVAVSAAGVVPYSGSINDTLDDVTSAASGSVTLSVTGTVSETLESATSTASGLITVNVTGSLAEILEDVSVSALGAVVVDYVTPRHNMTLTIENRIMTLTIENRTMRVK